MRALLLVLSSLAVTLAVPAQAKPRPKTPPPATPLKPAPPPETPAPPLAREPSPTPTPDVSPAPAPVASTPAPTTPPAAEAKATEPVVAPPGFGFVLGLQVGGLLQFTGVRASPSGALELGLVTPLLSRGLGVVVTVAYAQPTSVGEVTDPRVPSGSASWSLTQRQVTLSPAVLYRLTSLGRVVPFIAAGLRVFLLEQTVSGSAGGQAIAPTVEQSTRYGVVGRLGVELGLGPGGVTIEAQVDWANLGTMVAGQPSTLAGVSGLVGYRLVL
jgi:hypothetical protein